MKLFVLTCCFVLTLKSFSQNKKLYFPPVNSSEWKTTNLKSEGWNHNLQDSLYNLLKQENTRAFIVLKDGKILMEQYWGKNFRGRDFNKNSYWYWASAGKTLTAFLVGIAQEQNLLDIENSTSQYLGRWTTMPKEKEDAITIKHQLTMTTGLDYSIKNQNCTKPECLMYKAEPGKQWYYHNAPYTLLRNVIEQTSDKNYNTYSRQNLTSKIGMKGMWRQTKENNNLYFSTPRSAARFGLLILNKGDWDGKQVLVDKEYFKQMTSTSQNINPSYGYLWWLNGKGKLILPTMTQAINQDFVPKAPKDMISALGKNGQIIDVVPSKNLVVVRMGEKPNADMIPVIFHRKYWQILEQMMPD
jgi:CubicO group peptidase (beta-lactamase class C family)